MTFPIDMVNERSFDPGWAGEVFICDIDRTYLYTRFSSLKGITRIPFEFAVDKQDIEGMAVLLKEVRRGPERESRHTPLYFVSASPSQLRQVIQRKMLLDGLEFDGTIFKDWLGVLASLRVRRFKEQLGFKLTALLQLREHLPHGAREVLMGDDLETDALAFSLYSDALSGRLDGRQVLNVLRTHGVARDDARNICEHVSSLRAAASQPFAGVRRALIRMERHGAPEDFLEYAPRLWICKGAFQMALGLWSLGSLSTSGVCRVARDLGGRGISPDELDDRFRDCARRGLVAGEQARALRADLASTALLSPHDSLPEVEPAWQATLDRADEPMTPRRLWD